MQRFSHSSLLPLLLAAAALPAAGEGALNRVSPFSPSSVSAAPAAESVQLEYRGRMQVGRSMYFNIHNLATGKSSWLKLNEPGAGFVVSGAGFSPDSVQVNAGGRLVRLELVKAMTQKSSQPPPVAPAGQLQPQNLPPISPVVLNPTPADEARRLEDFAAEVRRRRELRQQQASGQPRPPAPQGAQPAQR
jgi:hypothetical protein